MDLLNRYQEEITKYPARYGALSGLMFVLLQELNEGKILSEDRINYYSNRFKSIDKENAFLYTGDRLEKANKETTKEEGGINL